MNQLVSQEWPPCAASWPITVTSGRSRCWRSPSHISKRMRSCSWSCRLGLPTKDAVPAQEKAWPDRGQTWPSMRSASVLEDKRWIMGQRYGVCAPSPTNFDVLLKESCERVVFAQVRRRRFMSIIALSSCHSPPAAATSCASVANFFRLCELTRVVVFRASPAFSTFFRCSRRDDTHDGTRR